MAVYLSCKQIGIEGCDYETRGAEGHVLRDMVTHIRQTHGFELAWEFDQETLRELPEPERMISSRIWRAISLPDEAA